MSLLQITADPTVSSNGTSLFTVTVSDAAGVRSSKASVTVSVVSAQAPLVSISSAFTSKVSVGIQLKLFGSVSLAIPGTASWSVSSGGLDLSTASLTPTTVALTGSADSYGSVFNSVNLVLQPGSLSQRSTYVFSLTCRLSTGSSAYSSVSVVTNGAPLPGVSVEGSRHEHFVSVPGE